MAKKTATYLDFILRGNGFENDFSAVGDLPEEVKALKDSFEKDQYRTLYELGFKDATQWFSPSLQYLHKVSGAFLANIAHQPDLEILRQKVEPDYDQDVYNLERSVPFIPGSEVVDGQWIKLIWERLLDVFRSDIQGFDGTVDLYLAGHNNDIHSPGRIFFHLVENKTSNPDIAYDFVFMATYSPGPDERG